MVNGILKNTSIIVIVILIVSTFINIINHVPSNELCNISTNNREYSRILREDIHSHRGRIEFILKNGSYVTTSNYTLECS